MDMVVVEDGYGSLWHIYEVGGRDEAAFVKLYESMHDARLRLYRSGGYNANGWLPSDRSKVGKGSEVNRNEGLGSVLRDKLNRLVRKTKGCSKSIRTPDASLAPIWARQGWI